MFKQLTRYGAGLIALYVVVANGSSMGSVITAGAEGTSKITRTLQGR
jgi:hypothetical protein